MLATKCVLAGEDAVLTLEGHVKTSVDIVPAIDVIEVVLEIRNQTRIETEPTLAAVHE